MEPMQTSEFPKYMYHESGEATMVENADQEHELGEGWEDSPSKFGVVTHPSAADRAKADREAKMARTQKGKMAGPGEATMQPAHGHPGPEPRTETPMTPPPTQVETGDKPQEVQATQPPEQEQPEAMAILPETVPPVPTRTMNEDEPEPDIKVRDKRGRFGQDKNK